MDQKIHDDGTVNIIEDALKREFRESIILTIFGAFSGYTCTQADELNYASKRNILHEFKLTVDLLHVYLRAVYVHIDICVKGCVKGKRKRERKRGREYNKHTIYY